MQQYAGGIVRSEAQARESESVAIRIRRIMGGRLLVAYNSRYSIHDIITLVALENVI